MTDAPPKSLRHWLPVAGLSLALLITIGAALNIVQSRQRTLSDADRELSNLSLVIAEQTDRAFQSVELVQTSLIERFTATGMQNRDDYARVASTEEVHHALSDKISGLPQVDAITLIDAAGKLINFSRYWPIPAVNVSDRDYFKALSEDPKLTSFVSAPVPNRGTGTWTIYLARKVRAPSGEFLGLVLGAIRLDHFEQFYGSLSLGPRSAVALLRRDGVVLARYPRSETMIGRSVFNQSIAVTKAAQGQAVTVQQVSPIDGRERFVSARGLSRYPLIVTVSQELDSVLEEWRGTSFGFAAKTALIDLLIGIAAFLGMRQMKEQRRLASASHFAARHDALTALPNRLMLREELEKRFSGTGHFCLIWVDLDQFKAVNDSFGHAIGDELLIGVAERLRECCGVNDLVVRLGGDEFAIVHPSDTADASGVRLAERILRRLAEPFKLQACLAQIGASAGLAMRPHDGGGEAAELMRNADLALYRAKSDGRGRCRLFEPVMAAQLRTKRALERDLARAVERNELALVYQPVVSMTTGRPIGFEALLRWNHPVHGNVPPADFIPLAELNGLIVPIGEWVIREACREAATWPGELTVAVNLSPAQLASGRVVETVAQALDTWKLDPQRLELEITETALLHDDDAVLGALHKLRASGVRIALDDFGVGYSSLSYLTSFPFDRIKIDRSFIQRMKVSETSLLVVCTILQLAKRLGVATTGEGVETMEHLEALRNEGCTDAQGFYYGRPQSAADIRQKFMKPALRLVEAA